MHHTTLRILTLMFSSNRNNHWGPRKIFHPQTNNRCYSKIQPQNGDWQGTLWNSIQGQIFFSETFVPQHALFSFRVLVNWFHVYTGWIAEWDKISSEEDFSSIKATWKRWITKGNLQPEIFASWESCSIVWWLFY